MSWNGYKKILSRFGLLDIFSYLLRIAWKLFTEGVEKVLVDKEGHIAADYP